jgi:hypothetical protein
MKEINQTEIICTPIEKEESRLLCSGFTVRQMYPTALARKWNLAFFKLDIYKMFHSFSFSHPSSFLTPFGYRHQFNNTEAFVYVSFPHGTTRLEESAERKKERKKSQLNDLNCFTAQCALRKQYNNLRLLFFRSVVASFTP